jgi:hypothetical protein
MSHEKNVMYFLMTNDSGLMTDKNSPARETSNGASSRKGWMVHLIVRQVAGGSLSQISHRTLDVWGVCENYSPRR